MWLKPFIFFLLSIPVKLLGIPLVALGLLFRRECWVTRKPFTQYPGEWMMVRLPALLRWWDNLSDGFLGDKRGWWDNYCREHYGKPASAFFCMWMWGAFRNPANYFSRVVIGLDVSRCAIHKWAGDDTVIEEPGCRNWQVIVAVRDDGARFPRFFMSLALPGRPDKALMIDIGWKIKLAHNGTPKDAPESERLKGLAFVVSPWKTLA